MAAFISKLNDAEGEAAEIQDWIEYAVKCGYMERAPAARLFKEYDAILKTLVGMITHADKWVFPLSATAVRSARRAS
jgi:four helix bundle protein